MAKDRSRDINRTAFSTWAPADPGTGTQNFNLIDLGGYRGSSIYIYGIEWGAIIQNATDRTNFLSHYCALLRNARINDDNGISTSAPIAAGGTSFTDITWMQSINNLQAYPGKAVFNRPLIVSDDSILILPSPSLSAGITGAIYTYCQLIGEIIAKEDSERLGKFKLV